MKINKEDGTMIVFSTNDEDFDYEDLEGALEAAFDCQFADDESRGLLRVYEGDMQCKKASAYAPTIADRLGENAYSDCSEFSDCWPHSTDEQDHELQQAIDDVIDAWADKYGLHPEFGEVERLGMRVFKRVNIREDFDIDDYREVCDED